MPRYRRHRAPKVKLPKAPKFPRPKVKDLRVILKGLLTASVPNRINSLAYVCVWYENAVPYLISKKLITPDGQKKINLAGKCRNQAAGTIHEGEKETSLLMAVRAFEKACAALKTPAVDKYMEKLKARAPKLEKKMEKMELKYGPVVQLLQKSFGDRVKLHIADAAKPRQYDPTLTSLTYNREAVKGIVAKFRAEGLFAVFIEELPYLAQHVALEPNTEIGHEGEFLYDPEKQLQITEELLRGFLAFGKGADAPKKLIKNGVIRIPVVKQPTLGTPMPGIKRVPRASNGGARVGGFLDPNSAIGIVYTRLEDQQEHNIKDVIVGLTTSDPVGRVKQLQRYGIQKGGWTVNIIGEKVQMILNQAAQTVQP